MKGRRAAACACRWNNSSQPSVTASWAVPDCRYCCERFPPIEPDPARSHALRLIDERAEFGRGAIQGKHLLDYDGFSYGKSLERLEIFDTFASLRIQVNRDEVQFGSDLLGHEARGDAGTVKAPGNQAHRDHVVLVVFANSGHQPMTPLPGDCGPRAFFLPERDELHEVPAIASQEGRPEPVAGLPVARGRDRLVHQVVAEDGWAFAEALGHAFPELGLNVPPLPLAELVIPGRNVALAVAAEAGDVQIKAGLLGHGDQAAKARRSSPGSASPGRP